ncbi:hypothetical protein [Fuerstiella marisgermanici]|uniref:Uncharacterized protein n=1 Tax=Fuerstiella marisgermanici TaxID=1891926 RepID=A0A1P8WES8_9PLAN|nr:hypothetical protein [Fuerstiella marisgermanici]APZ92549.1 hypothetical protein Fuma_02160 [Fuerstiella marisgermanici]
MTDQSPTIDKPLFSAVEVEQFEADDVVAGSAIGRMLSFLFLYTVLAMTFVVWWTFDSVTVDSAAAEANAAAAEHDDDHDH